MEENNFDGLKLENQLCFPLYACAKELIRAYKPHLDKLDLTYTQYIAMMVMWEKKSCSVKELGEMLFLDSGTLTPVLKKLEIKGFVERKRSCRDERTLIVSTTEQGNELRERAAEVPRIMGECLKLEPEEAVRLYGILHKILGTLADSGNTKKNN